MLKKYVLHMLLSILLSTQVYGNEVDKNTIFGNWKNTSEEARGLTKIALENRSGVNFIKVYGMCVPDDCEWGEERFIYAPGYPGEAYYNFNYKFVQLVINLISDDIIKVNVTTTYPDKSRKDYEFVNYMYR